MLRCARRASRSCYWETFQEVRITSCWLFSLSPWALCGGLGHQGWFFIGSWVVACPRITLGMVCDPCFSAWTMQSFWDHLLALFQYHIFLQLSSKSKTRRMITVRLQRTLWSTINSTSGISRVSKTCWRKSVVHIFRDMSFGVDFVDFCSEACHESLTVDRDRFVSKRWTDSLGQPSCFRTQPSRRVREPSHKMPTGQSNLKAQCTSPPLKKQKQSHIPTSKLIVRATGFKDIFNRDIPLDILHRLIDCHPFLSSTGGLRFPTDLLRRTGMRGAWKLSSSETVSTISLEPLGGSNVGKWILWRKKKWNSVSNRKAA